jgi:hypothetical protein
MTRSKTDLSIVILLPVSALLLAGWTHGHGATTYDGIVATRGSAPSVQDSHTQVMSRVASFTRSAVTQIKIITPNWYAGENTPGATATLTASIEYPVGVCTQLKWSTATSVTVSDGGQVTSDYATLSIPTNTQFWIREYMTNASGVPVDAYQGQNLALGDALILGNSGVVDQTVSCGTVTDGGTFESLAPLAIIAPITAPSVCILGDSIALGVDNAHTPNSTGDSGAIAPSIAPSFGYSNMGVNGDTASTFASTLNTNRRAVLSYCSHLIVEYGTNDFSFGGSSVAQLQTDLTTIYGFAPVGTVTFQTTLFPRTCSTDSWATTTNQSPEGTGSCNLSSNFESKRATFDAALIGGTFGPNGGFFDPDSVVGTGTNNSLWRAGAGFPTCNPWTDDGVHPNTCSYYTVLQSSGYIDLSRIHRP